MNVSITARHMDMTPAIKDYVQSALEKIRGHFEKVIDVEVILSVEKHRHIAEFNLHANGLRINAKESSSDMYLSVDAAIQKVDRQVLKFKDRINRHKPRRDRKSREFDYAVIEVDHSSDHDADDGDSTLRHREITREQVSIKPMSIDEAALQLELLDDVFLVFSNDTTQQMNVIYGRKDGTYGLIEPQF